MSLQWLMENSGIISRASNNLIDSKPMSLVSITGSIASTLNNKAEAFERAFEKYWPRLYNHARRKVNDQKMAEDLIQECFVVLWNNEEILTKEDEHQAFLYGVLRHKILDIYRRDEVRLRYANDFAKKPQNYSLAPDEQMIAGELQKIIEDELSQMPPRMIEIYHLKRELNLSISQIANKLGISVEISLKLTTLFRFKLTTCSAGN